MKRFLKRLMRRRRLMGALALVLVVAAIFWAVNSPAIVGASATKRELPIYCVQRDNKVVSLTFDAAWGNEDTEELIAIMAKYNIRSTFFLVGSWVDKYPQSVKQLSDAGMEIMNHSDSHPHMAKLSAEEICAELTACNDKIEAITGVAPALFRCPYGEYDDNAILSVRSAGMEPIQWDVDSLDWKGLSAGDISERVLSRVKPGSIVLFHNAAENTPEALPAIIESLLADGYEIVPVSELLLTGGYEIDNTGMMYPSSNM